MVRHMLEKIGVKRVKAVLDLHSRRASFSFDEHGLVVLGFLGLRVQGCRVEHNLILLLF